MPIVFAAITSHTPLLLPTIGKEGTKKLKKTLKALARLEEDLYAAQPDVVIIFSPHGKIIPDAFHINSSPEYTANFREFGDFSTQFRFRGNISMCQSIRADWEVRSRAPVVLSSDHNIDYGTSIPLSFLLAHLKETPIIPVHPSGLSLTFHCSFGDFLKRQLHKMNIRAALIASGDLSHCLTKNSPGGYSKKAVLFNKKIIDFIREKNVEGFMKADQEQMREASICCHRVFTMLFCLLDDVNYKLEFLSYEYPFGVGYLTAEMLF